MHAPVEGIRGNHFPWRVSRAEPLAAGGKINNILFSKDRALHLDAGLCLLSLKIRRGQPPEAGFPPAGAGGKVVVLGIELDDFLQNLHRSVFGKRCSRRGEGGTISIVGIHRNGLCCAVFRLQSQYQLIVTELSLQ